MLEEEPSIEREYRLSSYKPCNNVNQFCWFPWAQISFSFLLSFWCRVLLCSPGWLRMGNPLPAFVSLVLESQVCTTRILALLSISRLGELHTPSSHLAKMQSRRLVVTQQPTGTLHDSLRGRMGACTPTLEVGFCKRVCTSGRVGGAWGSPTVTSHTWFLLFHQHWRISWQHRSPCQDGLHHSHS